MGGGVGRGGGESESKSSGRKIPIQEKIGKMRKIPTQKKIEDDRKKKMPGSYSHKRKWMRPMELYSK